MTDNFEAARAEAQRRADAFEELMDRVIADIQHRTHDQHRTDQETPR